MEKQTHPLKQEININLLDSIMSKRMATRLLRSFYGRYWNREEEMPSNGELLHFYDNWMEITLYPEPVSESGWIDPQDDSTYTVRETRGIGFDGLGKKTIKNMEDYFSQIGLGKHAERVADANRPRPYWRHYNNSFKHRYDR